MYSILTLAAFVRGRMSAEQGLPVIRGALGGIGAQHIVSLKTIESLMPPMDSDSFLEFSRRLQEKEASNFDFLGTRHNLTQEELAPIREFAKTGIWPELAT